MAATGNNGHQPEPAGADERWMGVEDAAGHLALPVRTVYRLAQRGAIPAVKVGRTWRFKRSLLDTHLATGASSAASAASRPVPARPAPPRADHPRAGRRSQSPPLLDTVSALTDLSVDLSGLRDAAEIGTVLAARLAAPFQVELVALLAREGRDLVSVGPTGDVQLPAGWRLDAAADGLAERIATADAPLAIDDVSAAGDHSIANLGLRSVLFVPIQSGGSWGVLALGSVRPRTFDPIEVDRLIAVAGQTGLALTNAALLAETTRWSAQLERRLASQRQLLEITERLLATRARDGVFEAVADTLAEVVPHDTLTIYLVDREAGCLVPVLARDAYAEQVLASRPRIGQGITGNVIERGEAELINDANSDPRVVHVPGTPTDENESMIVAPIRGHDAAVGSLNLYRTDRLFDEDDLELARLFTNHVAIALENAGVHDRLLRAARTDPLTGLPNRRFFGERVEQAIARRARQAGRLAVLFLDLDGFKLVNDGLGHAAGDLVLAGVAERLRACVRTEDTVARLGGDEFGILLEDVTGAEDAVRTATRVVTSLGAPLTVDGRTWVVRASIGIAVADGAETSSDELLRDADTAMYRAKAEGTGSIAVFEPSMHAAQVARLELDSALRDALARAELSLRFQPIVELATGRIAAVEALLRWDHPTRGLVSPLEFIPVAEETGLIVPIGAWVLGEACRTFSAWRRDGIAPADIAITVNTSVRQLTDPGFPDDVEKALRDTGLQAECLVLEVTESVMLADETVAVAALRRLRDRGVRVAIDDFGTGYSSLGQLRRLPVDEIKIDRSFVDGLGTEREKAAIVRAAIAFATALDLSVTAEGIETALQLDLLAGLGCRYGQGYWFAPPLMAERAAELLGERRRFDVPSPASVLGAPAA